MASTPYPFTASPSSNGSNSRPPVQYPRLQQRQDQTTPATVAANTPQPQKRGYYAQAPSNSPSTASLLPPSARGPPTVQAAFAQGPKPALRNVSSNSDIVRSHALAADVVMSSTVLSSSTHRLTVLVQRLNLPLSQASQYRTRQVSFIHRPWPVCYGCSLSVIIASRKSERC